MSEHIGLHEITPEFRARLDWQVATALRRESRFVLPVTGGRWRRLRVAVVLLCTLAVGGLGGVASAQVQDARERVRLLAAARSELALAEMRLELARVEFLDAEQRRRTGLIETSEFMAASAAVRALEASLRAAELGIDEIRITGLPPNDALTAPLVDGRDFVQERLRSQVDAAEAEVRRANHVMSTVEQRVKLGLADSLESLQAGVEAVRADGALEALRTHLQLRAEYLSGEIRTEDLPLAVRRAELRLELRTAALAFTLARHRFHQMENRLALGQATARDVLRAELQMLEREADLEVLRRELALLGGGDAPEV
jgi:outer membrane protein TolC